MRLSRFISEQILPSVTIIGEDWPDQHLFSDLLLLPDLFAKATDSWAISRVFAELVSILEDERTCEVIKSFAASPLASYRMLAPQALVSLRRQDSRTLQLLHRAVVDEHEDVRWCAVRALSDFKDWAILRLLRNCLSEDSSAINRAAILDKFYGVDLTSDIEAAIKDRALKDPDNHVRRVAIQLLAGYYGRSERDDALRRLLDAAKKDKDKEVRDFVATLSEEHKWLEFSDKTQSANQF